MKFQGKPYTAVEEEADFNDLCLIPNTGMFFVANEDKKMLTYYVPVRKGRLLWI